MKNICDLSIAYLFLNLLNSSSPSTIKMQCLPPCCTASSLGLLLGLGLPFLKV